ncbi:MAG: class I SAM-dependent methyltransferase family protein [Candidatus Aenigmarchaeota archaeon]|nr:class I SAM-dependent methyltransferase family protein [Candidatus Aenigmarchaeota archaeon]
MAFSNILQKELAGKMPEEKLGLLPGGYQIIGDILIVKLDSKLVRQRKLIGKAIIKIFPHIKTVCRFKRLGPITRKPELEIIAGEKNTLTVHKEHGCQFLIDVSQSMWSKGNKNERKRMAELAKPKETIVDMFAGIGYWTIFMAKHCKPRKIYAIDINPKAVEFLRKNTFLNNVEGKVEILEGDCRKMSKLLENTANRIVMGYIFDTEKFLPHAFRMARKNCTIHFHRNAKDPETVKEKLEKIAGKHNVKIKFLKIVKIKSYSPNTCHYVFDLKITKP